MKRRRLKMWVKPTIAVFTLMIIAIGLTSYIATSGTDSSLNNNYTIKALIDDAKPVVKEEVNIVKPFTSEKVSISKNYYNKDDDEKKQQESLIYYENIYIQNTGILYSSDEEFDVISVADGVVKNIKEDKILGNIIEVENNSALTTIYQSVNQVAVKVGDQVSKGTKIATSGNNKLSNEKDNCLLFQVYINGNVTNPETIYGMDINTLNE
ncbi:MAG: peptidoglycan DD-metalloendopeptidase family protein [Bacilli bacterium]